MARSREEKWRSKKIVVVRELEIGVGGGLKCSTYKCSNARRSKVGHVTIAQQQGGADRRYKEE